VANIIQGSPASQLMGVGELGQRTPLIESGDIIVKVRAYASAVMLAIMFLQVNSLFVPMQAPDSSITRGPLTLSIRKRGGRTISVIVERGASAVVIFCQYFDDCSAQMFLSALASSRQEST
jgi:hypothetical protein